MKKKFERTISRTQSKFRANIERKNVTQQCSYNLPNDIEPYLKNLDAIERVAPFGDDTHQLYELKNGYKISLSSNIYAVIGDEYKSKAKKVIFTHTEGPNGESAKFQLKRTDFSAKGEEYKWFVDLYDKNIEGVNFVTYVDDVAKEIIFDIELTLEIFNGAETTEEEEDVEVEESLKELFIAWLFKEGKKESYIKVTLTSINTFSKSTGNNIFEISDINEIENLYNFIKTDSVWAPKDESTNRHYSSAIKLYGNFLQEYLENETNKTIAEKYDNCDRLKGGRNIILYGVPGAGKSYTIETEYCKDEDKMERLVFHPDYTYSDFVGQILPSIDESGESKTIQYKFEPGPFTTLLKKAYRDPDNKYYLIIEEINRGNAPAIFGDVFQLLDRKPDGTSMYGITNTDIAKIVYDDPNHKVRIPSNMSILCTMNTSDQNVFTLDTAFQRRWNMRLIENTFKENDVLANIKILDSSVTWRVFQETINEIILNTNVRLTSAEDKRLGTHFVVEEDLKYNDKADKGTGQEQIDAKLENRRFAEKVIKYLWDDAFKFNRESLFNVRDNGTNNSLEAIIRSFLGAKGDARFDIFLDNIKRTMIDESKPKDEATGDADGTSETN